MAKEKTKTTDQAPSQRAAFAEQAKGIFEKMDIAALHFTNDGQAFTEPGDAKNHARTLGKKSVITIKREDVDNG